MSPTTGVRRRSVRGVTLGLAVLAMVGAACGSSGSTTTNGYKATGDATSQQVSNAHTLNLSSADVPKGWSNEKHGTGPNVVRLSLDGCVTHAIGGTEPVTTAVSTNFEDLSNGREIGSQVQVYKTSAAAMSAAARAGSSRVGTCLSSAVQADMPKTLPKTETLQHVTVMADGVPGTAKGEFSQRVVTEITYPISAGKTGGTTVYVDVVGFARGDAVVEVEFESSGSVPPPSLEQQALAPLMARAQAAS